MPREGPIIQEKPVIRPGAKRQKALALFIIIVIIIILTGAYIVFRPRDDSFIVRSYQYTTVKRGDIWRSHFKLPELLI